MTIAEADGLVAITGPAERVQALRKFIESRAPQSAARESANPLARQYIESAEEILAAMVAEAAWGLHDTHPMAPLARRCPVCGARPGLPCKENPDASSRWIAKVTTVDGVMRPSVGFCRVRWWPGSNLQGTDRITLGKNPHPYQRWDHDTQRWEGTPGEYHYHQLRVFARRYGGGMPSGTYGDRDYDHEWLDFLAELRDDCPTCGAKAPERCTFKRQSSGRVHATRRRQAELYVDNCADAWLKGQDLYPDGYTPEPPPNRTQLELDAIKDEDLPWSLLPNSIIRIPARDHGPSVTTHKNARPADTATVPR